MGTIASRSTMAPCIYHQYEVIGRHVPTERDPSPKAYRIKLFTKNETQARSRFWYFIRRLVKMKKANAEILSVREIFEKKPDKVSKYGIWIRYDSRSGTTNMYKEFSTCTQNEAVAQMYQEIAGELKEKCVRARIKQFLDANVKFPLTHRQPRSDLKGRRKGTLACAPTTFKN